MEDNSIDVAEETKKSKPFLGSFTTEPEDGAEVTKATETVTEPVPEAVPVVVAESTTVEETKTDPSVTTADWGRLGSEFGLTTEEQVVEKLRSSRDLENKYNEVKKSIEGIDPLALDIDKAKKAGLDLDLYLEARKMDTGKLTNKEALKKRFFLENQDYDKDLASTLFEDEYETKYGILEIPLTEIELEDNAKKIELAKARLAAEAIKSKKFLDEWKSKNVSIGDPKQGLTEEEQAEIRNAYYKRATSFVEELGELEVTVGDKVFKYGVDDKLKDIEADIKDPFKTLKRFGVDLVTGDIDTEKFGEVITKLYALENIGKPLADWALEQSNAQHVKQRLDAPAPTHIPAGGEPGEKTHEDKLAEAFEAMRARKRQG